MIGPDFRSGSVRDRQAIRDLDALPWAAKQTTVVSVKLSKLIVLGLTPVCAVVWALERWA